MLDSEFKACGGLTVLLKDINWTLVNVKKKKKDCFCLIPLCSVNDMRLGRVTGYYCEFLSDLTIMFTCLKLRLYH